jgi:hypothetical protein
VLQYITKQGNEVTSVNAASGKIDKIKSGSRTIGGEKAVVGSRQTLLFRFN